MKTRGKVLREANSSPGRLRIESQQFRLSRDGIGHAQGPSPRGRDVAVKLNDRPQVTSITAVPDSDQEPTSQNCWARISPVPP